MSRLQTDVPTVRKPLRLWPGIVAALLLVLGWFVVPVVAPDASMYGLLGAVAAGLVIILWWLLFSRAPWAERLGALALMAVALAVTRPILHPSIAGAGMGMMFFLLAIPGMSLALVVWATACRRFSGCPRRASLVATILLACGAWALLRTGGISGEGHSDLHWRWSETSEERLLAREPTVTPPPQPVAPAASPRSPATAAEQPRLAAPARSAEPGAGAAAAAPAAIPAAAKTDGHWPGFRGAHRDGVVRGIRIETDWSRTPPAELWRRPIGPGWSSFAVRGDLVYTQEQRGGDEIVSCYRLSTGEPVWRHRDAVRFYESNGGAGPRGTPAVHDGRVYALGATGILNALDAESGAVAWSRNAAADTGAPLPGWGFAGSPLVVDDLLVVATGGRFAAYDLASGHLRWTRQTGGGGYSSPHLATIDGVSQILLVRGGGVTSVAPADGSVLWEHSWPGEVGIVQPAMPAEHDVLITAGDMMGGIGIRRISVSLSKGWTVEERWTSRGLKPYFNDFVIHKGRAIGFDGSILSCIDIENGERKWKGGRYGNGQLVLLPEQDLLLVVSEEGELALVSATADTFTELSRFQAIEGKTWNHPVVAGDVLLVRNGEEMAAFRLPLAGR